ncbi:hypothetical protein [Pontibacter pamirensis]|uniref:hypothetical protein n=1 Tax=Pontibacter pamirensis TaxID=2562824 RepID=UPI001389621C|nr:hypothetical protein [Pontibacter pamirensis]
MTDTAEFPLDPPVHLTPEERDAAITVILKFLKPVAGGEVEPGVTVEFLLALERVLYKLGARPEQGSAINGRTVETALPHTEVDFDDEDDEDLEDYKEEKDIIKEGVLVFANELTVFFLSYNRALAPEERQDVYHQYQLLIEDINRAYFYPNE